MIDQDLKLIEAYNATTGERITVINAYRSVGGRLIVDVDPTKRHED